MRCTEVICDRVSKSLWKIGFRRTVAGRNPCPRESLKFMKSPRSSERRPTKRSDQKLTRGKFFDQLGNRSDEADLFRKAPAANNSQTTRPQGRMITCRRPARGWYWTSVLRQLSAGIRVHSASTRAGSVETIQERDTSWTQTSMVQKRRKRAIDYTWWTGDAAASATE